MACDACVQATPAINKARHEPTRKNFIKQISKMRPAECCEGAKSWGPMHSHGRPDCSRISQGTEITPYFHTIKGLLSFSHANIAARGATQAPVISEPRKR